MEKQVVTTHPSYGLLQISRASGGNTPLFGSSVVHSHRIILRIDQAEQIRGLHEERYHPTKGLIEIEMSPVQWVEAITNMNHCPGSPCTITQTLEEGRVPNPPPQEHFVETFKKEFREDVRELTTALNAAKADVTALRNQKTIKKSDIDKVLETIQQLEMAVRSNIPFIHEQFERAIDKTVSQAKGEIDSFYTNLMTRLGEAALQQLAAKPSVPALESEPVALLEGPH
jgi:hypothetical protein